MFEKKKKEKKTFISAQPPTDFFYSLHSYPATSLKDLSTPPKSERVDPVPNYPIETEHTFSVH